MKERTGPDPVFMALIPRTVYTFLKDSLIIFKKRQKCDRDHFWAFIEKVGQPLLGEVLCFNSNIQGTLIILHINYVPGLCVLFLRIFYVDSF